MTEHSVRVFGMLLAEYARIEAMKAENKWREQRGETIAYGEDNFNAAAQQLDTIARMA